MRGHPFESLSARSLAVGSGLLAAAVVGLTAILLDAVPAEHRQHVSTLLAAGTPAQASQSLSTWPNETFAAFSFMLGFDYLYDLVHNNAVAFLAVWGARRCAKEWARVAGSIIAWTMWLGTALNIAENLAFHHIIRTLEPWPLLPIASATFSFRAGTWIISSVVALLLHAAAGRK